MLLWFLTGGRSFGKSPLHDGETLHNGETGRQQPSADNGQRYGRIRGRERAKGNQSAGPVQESYRPDYHRRRFGKPF